MPLEGAWKNYLWGLVVAIVPFVLYAQRLVSDSLQDVPEAYLTWIPILGFFWMYWRMQHQTKVASYPSGFFGSLTAVILVGVVVLLLGEPSAFSWPEAILVLWPLWVVVTVTVLYGRDYAKTIIVPAIYLYLAWPPLFIRIINIINPYLERWSYLALEWFSRGIPWIVTVRKMPVEFAIWDVHHWVDINVTAACSGTDSLLALLVIFPIVLLVFDVSWWRKALIVTLGCVVAFWGNAVRIFVIFWVTHIAGVFWAFSVVHPLIGPIMFLLLVIALLAYGGVRVTSQTGKAASIKVGRLPYTMAAALFTAIILVVSVNPFSH